MESRNTQLGYKLFLVYLVLYGGFVLLAAFSPTTMDKIFGGLNLAVIYGFSLIISAVVLALVYGVICKSDNGDNAPNNGDSAEGETV